MSVFDKMDSDFERLEVIKNAELVNIPFRIVRLFLRKDVEDKMNGGKKDSMLTTIQIVETGEERLYFGENSVVLRKLKFLMEEVPDFADHCFKLVYKKSPNGNSYYDLEEVGDEVVPKIH